MCQIEFQYTLILFMVLVKMLTVNSENVLNTPTTHALIPSTTISTLLDLVANSTTILATLTSGTSATTSTTSTRTGLVRCGNTQAMVDECFQDLPQHLMEFLQTTKIVINEREIAQKCKIFHKGMSCFENYTARCLPHKKRNIFKYNVDGARKFFKKFCGDRDFQTDYLKHKDCFTYIQEDWMRCTKSFQDILSEELHTSEKNLTHKFMEFCCARYAYEKCIYKSARYKCYQHSAIYARETARMLSDEKHFHNCRQYEQMLCNKGDGGATIVKTMQTIYLLIVSIALQILFGMATHIETTTTTTICRL